VSHKKNKQPKEQQILTKEGFIQVLPLGNSKTGLLETRGYPNLLLYRYDIPPPISMAPIIIP
jgi:hypothetical protein